jgi:MFS transporter, NNP family, nitrate/nitrite transporter
MESASSTHQGAYRWWVLAMVSLVNFGVIGASTMCMPVLFSEISQDLGLHLPQLLLIWGVLPLSSFIFSIPAGLLGDRYGVRWVCGIGLLSCVLFGALRANAPNFPTFLVIMFLFGVSIAFVGVNLPKIIGAWFPSRQLGLANGILLSAYGVGTALALAFSGTVLSPICGGWQNVFYFLGGVTMIIAALWLSTIKLSAKDEPKTITSFHGNIIGELGSLFRKRQIVLLCLIYFLCMGAWLGFSGSAPFLLEHVGRWPSASAHGLVSIGIWANVVGCLIMPMLSDRLGVRRPVLGGGLIITGGLAFLSLYFALMFSMNWFSWVLMACTGFCGGVLPLAFAIPLETSGIGIEKAGTAVGALLTSGNLGGFVFPALISWICGANPEVGDSLTVIVLCFVCGYGGAGVVAWLLQETGPKVQHRLKVIAEGGGPHG